MNDTKNSERPASTNATSTNGHVEAASPESINPVTGNDGSESSEAQPSIQETPDPLETARAEAARYKDQALRALADFDNFRKRTRRELDDAKKQGKDEVIREFLPVFDNVERAILTSNTATDVAAVVSGLQMVLRQLSEALLKQNITRVPGAGQQFDPQVHEAIQQMETDDHLPGTILAEVQPGYLHGDKLLRAAMVVVAKGRSTDA
jgi:molecular chaperone GrpE